MKRREESDVLAFLKDMVDMKMTGARILLECLKREGVDIIFGYPGGAVLDIYHDLNRDKDLRHILVRH